MTLQEMNQILFFTEIKKDSNTINEIYLKVFNLNTNNFYF